MKTHNLYNTFIGIECHIQLKTNSKLFSSTPNKFGCLPNTNIDIIDCGLPGTLPTLNKIVVNHAIALGLILKCDINKTSIFARKHYFYPDLPKGYQITQFDKPICENGFINIINNNKTSKINITRIHIEEDAGKNIHSHKTHTSYIDFNRAGVPLLEIVTKPDIKSANEAVLFIKTLQSIVRSLEISDGNMENGSIRTDANISVSINNQLGTKTEIKNLNSTKFLEQSINFEITRQINNLKNRKKNNQETRLWDPSLQISKIMRTKDNAHDYKYLPEPDLLPLIINNTTIKNIKKNIPELINEKIARFEQNFKLNNYNSTIIAQNKHISHYFEQTVKQHNNPKSIANWIINYIMPHIKNNKNININNHPIKSHMLAKIICLIDNNTINNHSAKKIFTYLLNKKNKTITELLNEFTTNDNTNELNKQIRFILKQYPKEVKKYQLGKTKLLGFFMGKIIQHINKNTNTKMIINILKEQLKNYQHSTNKLST